MPIAAITPGTTNTSEPGSGTGATADCGAVVSPAAGDGTMGAGENDEGLPKVLLTAPPNVDAAALPL